jgi:hypothetical protein
MNQSTPEVPDILATYADLVAHPYRHPLSQAHVVDHQHRLPRRATNKEALVSVLAHAIRQETLHPGSENHPDAGPVRREVVADEAAAHSCLASGGRGGGLASSRAYIDQQHDKNDQQAKHE